jgi:hypothetical protein
MTRHVPLQRDEQNSGFFDLDVLYTQHVEQLRMPAVPLAPVPRRAPPARRIETAPRAVEHSATRNRRVGWFAVFVAWLATMTTVVLVTTQLPGHIRLRTRVASVAPPPPTATPTATSTTASAPALTPTASGPPVVSFSDLPKSLPPAHPHVRHWAPRAPAAAQQAEEVSAPPAPPAPPAVTVAAPPVQPAPAPNATPSLEDLIRHEVAAEQKRLHGAPGK